MANKLNGLGVIKRFNGIDIHQTRHFVKIHCQSYIEKIVEHHGWQNDKAAKGRPIPMRTDTEYQKLLELNKGPIDPDEALELGTQMGFRYRQAIGELIFALTTCRLDISSAVIKLSQYSEAPAKCHYQAARQIFAYRNATKSDGIYYWRPEPNYDLPYEPLPATVTEDATLRRFRTETSSTKLYGASDSTWGTDHKSRKLVSGVVFMLAGGAIYYRTRIMPTIALSSTEAELAAMADAGKVALYI